MAQMTDEEIVKEAVEKLRSIFGNIPEPSKYILQNWLTDEFTKGAYSSNQVKYYYSRYYLRESLPGSNEDPGNARLHFAGEGTSTGYFGLIQGAIWEGERAGEEVARRLDTSRLGALSLLQRIVIFFQDLISLLSPISSFITSFFSK